MAAKKHFYMKFFTKDFKNDRKLNDCSAEANGVYIHLMCMLFDCKEKGKYLMQSECLSQFADILPRQNTQQSNQQIYQYIAEISRCITERLAKHLPFTIKEIERSIIELLQQDVLYIEGLFLCQKRMINDNKVSNSRSENGRKGAEATNKKKKDAEELAEILLRQNNQQKPNYNYNYKEGIDNEGGIGNTKGVQGGEKLGGEEEKEEVDFYAGNWHLETNVKDCIYYYLHDDDFYDDRMRGFELFKRQYVEFSDEQIWGYLNTWAEMFNDAKAGQYPNRCMRGADSWVQHFHNWLTQKNLNKSPQDAKEKFKTIKQKKEAFTESLQPHLKKYGAEMLNEFFRYWAEPAQNGIYLRWELEKSWDVAMRLSTWHHRNLKSKN